MHGKGINSCLNYSDTILKRNYCPRKLSYPSAMWQQEGDVTRPVKEKKQHEFIANSASVGHPKYLLLFFLLFIPLTS